MSKRFRIVPNQIGDPMKSVLVQQYQFMFIRSDSPDPWTEEDVDRDGIWVASRIPQFVEEYERMLGAKRGVPDDVRRPAHLI